MRSIAAPASERHLVAALQVQDAARFVRGGDLEAEALDDLARLADLLRRCSRRGGRVPIHKQSSSPTRTLPPMAAAIAAIVVPVHGFETPICAYAAMGIGPI